MKPHTKIYMDFFDYGEQDFIPSEISGQRAVDIHHIDSRGLGGDPTGSKDCIENLMGLTREEHIKYGDKPQYMEWLKMIHLEFMETRKPYHG
jgi:hypothetical protein